MKCSIVQQKMKRKTRNNPRPSGIFKKPCLKSDRRKSGNDIFTGDDEIPRDLKDEWRITIYLTVYEAGKIRKKQCSITINYWDIVDDRYSSFKGVLFKRIRQRLECHLPESNIDAVISLIREHLEPIQKKVLTEYQDSEEYYYRTIQQLLEEKRKQSIHKTIKKDPPPHLPPDEKMALEIIEAGYKKIAFKYHPDTGGDIARMQQLNTVKERMILSLSMLFKN